MPDTPRGSRPDPMSREVDRLLANLSSLGSRQDLAQPPRQPNTAPPPRPPRTAGAGRPAGGPTRADRIALWARVGLGIALGGAMTQWPYPHSCDLPLLGYLGAVATVLLAGAWIGFASWRLRSGAPHVLSLILALWGIALAAGQVLPRVGYAAERASWRCHAGTR